MMALKVPLYPAEKAVKKSVVAVTGCTGYLAGSIVHRLLETGHTVHGTCRDPNKAKALKQDLPGAADRLKLFKAELTQPGSFDEAFQGCDYVVHCASPYINNLPANEVEEKMLKPAIQGTQNVLESVNKASTVKRVALTSSCAAIYGSPVERGYGHVFTEDDWCTTPSATVLPYYYSKKGAEKAAWDIVEKQNRWELVVINPPVIFGPPMTGRPDGESLAMMTQVFKGELYPACPKMGFGMADVRDVAAAHTLALVHPNAKGRYICCPRSVEFSELCKEVAQLYPNKVKAPWMAPPKLLLWLFAPAMGLKRDFVKHTVGLPPPQFSCAKIQRDLGFQFLDMKTTITDMAEKMTELKLMP